MDEALHGQSVGSWLMRAHAESTPSASEHTVSEPAAPAISDRLREGRDPWEIWLHRVHQPRRRLAALGVNSPDSTP
jgi:hypothetical protein